MEWDWLQLLHSGDWAELTQYSRPSKYRKKRINGKFSIEALTAYCSQIPRQPDVVKPEPRAPNSKAVWMSCVSHLNHSIDFRYPYARPAFPCLFQNNAITITLLLSPTVTVSTKWETMGNISEESFFTSFPGEEKSPKPQGLTSSPDVSYYNARKLLRSKESEISHLNTS